jgi:hypothetical protein
MSGGGGGSGVGSSLMTAGLIVAGGAAILASGGLATPLVAGAAAAGGLAGAAVGSNMSNKAASALQTKTHAAINNLFSNKQAAPAAPSTSKASTAGIDTLRQLQSRSGRASTLLTSPGSQNTFGG